jgi:predicted Rossmann fold nucleotide-binding protein DprA/Smf involved in DNA uptake
MTHLSIALAALYLRGAPRPVELRRSNWFEVLRVLRRSGVALADAPEALRESGYWAEALVLEAAGPLEWGEEQVRAGRVLSAVDSDYPVRWLRVLGVSAPPALWKIGQVPALPCISVVGGRLVASSVTQFCYRTAKEAVSLGFAVVSGRAEGCDRAAARGAGRALIEILPHGLNSVGNPVGCYLAVAAPGELFTSALAMERNALIYAASSHTVIGQARFKEGGTWHGAVHAARSRLSTLLVRKSDDPAMRALSALGGTWLDSPRDLGAALKAQGPQGQLFESAV